MRTGDGVVFADGRGAVEDVDVQTLVVEGPGSIRGGEMSPVRGVDGDAAVEIDGEEGPKS